MINVVYIRTDCQEDNVLDQIQPIISFMNNNNISISRIYIDQNKSGKTMEDLPELQNMLESIDKIDNVFVKNVSRLSRNTLELYEIFGLLDRHGTDIRIIMNAKQLKLPMQVSLQGLAILY